MPGDQILAYANAYRVVCPPCATPAEVEERGGQAFVVVLAADEWAHEVVHEGVKCERCGKLWHGQTKGAFR